MAASNKGLVAMCCDQTSSKCCSTVFLVLCRTKRCRWFYRRGHLDSVVCVCVCVGQQAGGGATMIPIPKLAVSSCTKTCCQCCHLCMLCGGCKCQAVFYFFFFKCRGRKGMIKCLVVAITTMHIVSAMVENSFCLWLDCLMFILM